MDSRLKTYEADLRDTEKALDTLEKKRIEMEAEMEALSERKDALLTLIQAEYPHKGRLVIDQNMSDVSARVNVIQPRVTEAVKGILMASKEALTSAEIYEKLPQFGWKIEPSANPWALIHGIGRRLVAQQFAKQVYKDGRKAWIQIR